MGTYVGAAAQDSERLAADRAWVGWGVAAAVTGMLAWLAGFALAPPDAKLDKGEQHLVQVVRAHTGQLYAAGLLAVLGAVLAADSISLNAWPARPPSRLRIYRLAPSA
jgi:Na+/proline symporter